MAAEICCACGVEQSPGAPFFYCDESPQGDQAGPWCGPCFDKTPCGREEHGEGCETMMFSDGGEA